ncbi:MAG: hypothetical protein GKR91_02520 [Pseudomonadales bacterium]|nr:hypothetical protein [Pseudomonadales bacterium]
MPQIINTNIASLTAQRNLNRSQSANQQALTRLSSGLRINSSKDDAAGLAISTRFSSQIRGLNVAIRNVGDGVSLAQTADGALGTMTDNLQRIRELAIQSANATNSEVDREALQAEVSQLVAEISRTGEQTTFNGINLLDGDFNATFQIGANVGETVSFGISELTADSLGGGKSAGVSALGSSSALDNGDLVINGVVVGASTAADDSASTANSAASAIAKAAAINKVSDQTGVEATVLENTATGTSMSISGSGAGATSGTIELNGVTISIATGDVDASADRAAVVTAINAHSAETGVVASDSGSSAGGVTLTAADGRNIALSFAADASNDLTAASTGLTANAVTEGGYTLTSSDGTSAVVVTAGTGTLANAGLVEGSFAANTAAVNSTSRSSRAEVTSDVGDTGPLAATITGGVSVDLANANFSAGDTTFDLVISGATSTFEDGSTTVTLSEDYRSQTLQDLVDDINTSLSGSLAAEAFVLDGDKLGFRRTTAEAGDLQLDEVIVGSAPGGATTVQAALGLETTDTVGTGNTPLDSDTNAARGGQAGRAALTATAAVAASIQGNADFVAGDYSGTGTAQFDLIVADATTASDNGTYTLVIDTDFSNALYADFTADPDDAQRVVDELNADIANAGAAGIVEASFNAARTRLVFSRVNAETGGSVQLANYVASAGTDAATQATNFGFTDGRINTDTAAGVVALNNIGADAKAAGAVDAVSGTVTGVDTDSALISGGYVNGGTGEFSTFTDEAAAQTVAGGAATASGDFTGQVTTFDITDGTTSVSITLDTDYSDVDGVRDELNAQLFAGGSLITAVNNGGTLELTSSAFGASSEVTISSLAEGTTVTGFVDGSDSGTDGNYNFTYNLGGSDITVDLRAVPTAANGDVYDTPGDDGGSVLAEYINSFSGLDASFNATTNQFTITASDGTTDLSLVGGASNALEYLGLSAGSYDHTPAITGTATQAAVNLNALTEGDLKINGVTISSSTGSSDSASNDLAASSDKAASGIAIAAAINAASSDTGVSAMVNATVVDGGSSTEGTTARNADGDQGVIHINGFATGTLALGPDGETNRTDAIAAINGISGQTGVLATDAGGYIRLTASDGRNISIAIDNLGTTFTGSNVGLSVSRDGIGEADFAGGSVDFASVAETTASTVTLNSAKEFSISGGTNGSSGLAGLGLVAGTYGGSEDGQFLADLDITSVAGAEAAILALDNAIATVSSQRAGLGAIQNRLESTVGNLTITAENLTAANSRITDADFAVETAELSRSQVLQQAGISILAQANASSQQVLALLQ